jgi:hypothetical protein
LLFTRRRTRALGRDVARAMLWVSMLGLGACSRVEPNRESTAVSRQADTTGPCTFSAPPTGGTPTNVTFTVKTPQGVAPADFALASDLGSLRVESGVKLIKDAGGFGSVGSMEATARLFLGASVEGQSAYSELTGIDAGNNVRLHGVVKTANTLTRGSNVVIDGGFTQNTTLRPLATLSWTVAFPSLTRGNCNLAASQTQTIDPGTYGDLTINSAAHLKLRAGTYYFSSLNFQTGSFLDVDNAAGPIFVNVRNGFTWNGTVVETQSSKGNVVFSLATSNAITLQTAFRGLVVAPNSTLTIKTGGTPGQLGAFFGKSIVTTANTIFHHRPLSSAAVCTGTTECNGLCPCAVGGLCQNAIDCQVGLLCQAPAGGGAKVCTMPPIDDGNPCTTDSFVPGTGVVHTPLPSGTSCSDSNACNGAETCNSSGTCVAGTAPVVNDNNPCTTDACTPAGGVTHTPVATGTSCSDSNACNGVEACNAAGSCVAGPAPVIDDNNPCTTDSCNTTTGAVTHTNRASGSSCSDGNACNGSETCNSTGTCLAGTPVVIDDSKPCTTDSCNPSTGAVTHTNLPSGTSCADSNVCNGSETCNSTGTCLAGSAPNLNDNNACTTDACTPAGGITHNPVAVGTSCTDGNACNGAETCNSSATCVAGTPPVIDDGNPCTTDSCNTTTGAITHTNRASGSSCSDGNACNGSETCNSTGMCRAGTPLNTNDNNACTTDACNPANGAISHTAVAAGTPCPDSNACNGVEVCTAAASCVAGQPPNLDDGNACTTDTCTVAQGIRHTPRPQGSFCPDGNFCNGDEYCDAVGACSIVVPFNLDDGNPCTVDHCDPATGYFSELEPEGAPCSDGDICNGLETCGASGFCNGPILPGELDDGNACTIDTCDPVGGIVHTPVAIDDGYPCTTDHCDTTTGEIWSEYLPAGTTCGEATACVGAGTCNENGICLEGEDLVDDGNACTADSCDTTNGVVHTPLPTGTSCSDGNGCNGAETCNAGSCVSGTPVVVNDGSPCTVDACNPATGAVTHTPVAAGTACPDSDVCNGAERCNASGVCVAGPAPELGDDNDCTVDLCDASGIVHQALPEGSACSDGCAAGSCDANARCVTSTSFSLDDGNPCTVDSCRDGDVFHDPAAGISCDDGNPCNGAEICSTNGECFSTNPLSVSDGNPCTIDACDPALGITHVARAAGTSCSDGNTCNGLETCSADGVCRAGAALAIDDGNPCTLDACSPGSATITHTPVPTGTACSDQNSCNGLERCDAAGSCAPGTAPSLEDGIPCTIDSCDPVTGVSHTPNGEPGCSARLDWVVDASGSAPSPRDSFVAGVSSDGELALFGGDNAGVLGNDVWTWRSETQRWSRAAEKEVQPSPRAGAAGAADPARNRLVVFGGVHQESDGQLLSELWEYDFGTGAWVQPAGSTSGGPSARAYAAAAFDSQRGRVLFFGGAASADSQETWAWNGALGQWQLLATNGPSARYGAALAYDALHDVFVLFGGTVSTASGAALGDTWLFAPATNTWTPVEGEIAPSERAAHQLAFDPVSAKVVLFGGTAPAQLTLGDTWRFDVTTSKWSELAVVESPPARAGHALVYDPAAGALTVVGGLDYAGSGRFTRQQADVWQLDVSSRDARWVERSVAVAPARLAATAAYDAARGVLVSRTDELWSQELESSSNVAAWEFGSIARTWTRVPTGTSPGISSALVYDSRRARVLAVESAGNLVMNGPSTVKIAEWTGKSWQSDCSLSGTNVGAMDFAAVAYDETRGNVLLYGGRSMQYTSRAVRVMDPIACSVTNLWPESTPPPRDFPATVYVAEQDRLYVFGGQPGTYSAPLDDFWAFRVGDNQWTQLPGPGPSARMGARIAHDKRRGKLVLGAGAFEGAPTDTWEFDLTSQTWEQRAAANPAFAEPGAFVFDNVLGKVVDVAQSGRLRAWNGTTWDSSEPTVTPGARESAAAAWLPWLGRALLFGGTAGDGHRGLLGDSWLWNGTWRRLEGRVARSPGYSLAQAGSAIAEPPPRTGHTLAAGYVTRTTPYRDIALLFGGEGEGRLLSDTWSFDTALSEWVLWPASDLNDPTPRTQHAMSLSPLTGYLMFGGLSGAGVLQETWHITPNESSTGGAWENRTSFGTNPPARYGHAMATDVMRRQILLFGGRDATQVFGDTWVYDTTSLTWTRLTPPVSPRARFGHAMTYDSERQKIVLTGGASSTPDAALGDTWEWDFDTATWRPIPVPEHVGRAGHSLWFEPGAARLVAYGGITHHDAGTAALTFADTLLLGDLGRGGEPGWADNGISCTSDTECASGMCVDGICCNSRCTEQCAACDVAGHEGSCSPVAGAPHSARPACPGDQSTCAQQCDGSDVVACHFPTTAAVCGTEQPGECSGDGEVVAPAHCDGAGACVPAIVESCLPYSCCPTCTNPGCQTQCFAYGAPCTDPSYRCGDGGVCVFMPAITAFTADPNPLHSGQPSTLSASANFSPAEFAFYCRPPLGQSALVCDYGAASCIYTPDSTGTFNCFAYARRPGEIDAIAGSSRNFPVDQ